MRDGAARRRQRHGRIAPQSRELLQRRRAAAVAGRVPTWPRAARLVDAECRGSDGAQTVADVALLLSAIAGPDPRSPIALGEAGSRFRRTARRATSTVRVAWWTDLGGVPVDRACRDRSSTRSAPVFEALGCRVDEAEPDFGDADEDLQDAPRILVRNRPRSDAVAPHRDRVKDTILWEIDRGERLDGQRDRPTRS